MIIFTGIFLLYTFLLLKLKRNEKKTIDLKSACTIGFFQAIALIPGLSRSGLTLTGGILSNNKINNTLKFSFYLYLIASFGAFILEITSINLNNIELYPIIISCIASFITTLFSIKWFFNKLNEKWILIFSIYSFVIGTINLMEHFSFI